MNNLIRTRLLNTLFSNPALNEASMDLDDRFDFAPSVNIIDNKGSYGIQVALPGIKKEDVKISLEKGVLTIEGERKEEKKEETAEYSRKEFHYGQFKRSFSVPDSVKKEDIKATFEDGILKMNLPKAPEEQKKTISIS